MAPSQRESRVNVVMSLTPAETRMMSTLSSPGSCAAIAAMRSVVAPMRPRAFHSTPVCVARLQHAANCAVRVCSAEIAPTPAMIESPIPRIRAVGTGPKLPRSGSAGPLNRGVRRRTPRACGSTKGSEHQNPKFVMRRDDTWRHRDSRAPAALRRLSADS